MGRPSDITIEKQETSLQKKYINKTEFGIMM